MNYLGNMLLIDLFKTDAIKALIELIKFKF